MKTYLESVNSEWFNQRIAGVMLVVFLAFAVLMIRLLYLQVVEGKEYRRLSEINSIRLHDIDAPRGLVFDRHGHMLVDNRPSFSLHIVLKDAKRLDETLDKLGRLMDETAADLKQRIKKSKRRGAYMPILLKEDIGRDLLATIEVHKFDLPGVVVSVSPRRHYLYEKTAAHLLGYVGEISAEELNSTSYAGLKGGDFIGKFGIEKAYEKVLRGNRGGRQVEVNATGQVVSVLNTVPALAGRNITLTIDQELQQTAEQLFEGKAGAAVAIDPTNGEVLAMVSSPTFDPNWFVSGMSREQWKSLIGNPFRPLENKAIQAEYPPASTYKIVTALAGLQEGVINADTTMFCPGHYQFGNRVYRCWKRGGQGEVNVVKALAESCDVFFYQVGEALGVDVLARYARACGLGELAGIHLDREAKGLVPTKAWKKKRLGESWQGGETLSVAIGQGFNLVTPMQMAVLAAAVGNGGTTCRPRLIKSIQSAEGAQDEDLPVSQLEVPGKIPVSPEILSLVRRGLWEVVNQPRGTAYRARLKQIEFSGKTGTAQVVGRSAVEGIDEDKVKEMHKDHAWFVAYAPSEAPRIAVAVIVEHGEHGSSTAAPIASQLIAVHLGAMAADDMAFLTSPVSAGPVEKEAVPND
jgi:penicillin-binding protein 2